MSQSETEEIRADQDGDACATLQTRCTPHGDEQDAAEGEGEEEEDEEEEEEEEEEEASAGLDAADEAEKRRTDPQKRATSSRSSKKM